MADSNIQTLDSNIQTLDTVKPITLDEYQERTAHLQENTTSLLSTIADRQVQATSLATQAASLASEVNAVAEQASLTFTKKTWTDNATSGTPITAAELNRLENAISSLTAAVNNLQDSVTHYNTKNKQWNQNNWSILQLHMFGELYYFQIQRTYDSFGGASGTQVLTLKDVHPYGTIQLTLTGYVATVAVVYGAARIDANGIVIINSPSYGAAVTIVVCGYVLLNV